MQKYSRSIRVHAPCIFCTSHIIAWIACIIDIVLDRSSFIGFGKKGVFYFHKIYIFHMVQMISAHFFGFKSCIGQHLGLFLDLSRATLRYWGSPLDSALQLNCSGPLLILRLAWLSLIFRSCFAFLFYYYVLAVLSCSAYFEHPRSSCFSWICIHVGFRRSGFCLRCTSAPFLKIILNALPSTDNKGFMGCLIQGFPYIQRVLLFFPSLLFLWQGVYIKIELIEN